MNDLAGLGVIDDGQTADFSKLLRMPGALPLPTADGLAVQADQRTQLLARWPGVELFANSAGPFATSLSDQVIQGLLLARGATNDLPPADSATSIDARTTACAH